MFGFYLILLHVSAIHISNVQPKHAAVPNKNQT